VRQSDSERVSLLLGQLIAEWRSLRMRCGARHRRRKVDTNSRGRCLICTKNDYVPGGIDGSRDGIWPRNRAYQVLAYRLLQALRQRRFDIRAQLELDLRLNEHAVALVGEDHDVVDLRTGLCAYRDGGACDQGTEERLLGNNAACRPCEHLVLEADSSRATRTTCRSI